MRRAIYLVMVSVLLTMMLASVAMAQTNGQYVQYTQAAAVVVDPAPAAPAAATAAAATPAATVTPAAAAPAPASGTGTGGGTVPATQQGVAPAGGAVTGGGQLASTGGPPILPIAGTFAGALILGSGILAYAVARRR